MRDSATVLNREFLELRSRVLELAAALDRLDRSPDAPGPRSPDQRLAQLRRAIETLLEPGPGRAEKVQTLFSLEYDPRWRENHAVAAS